MTSARRTAFLGCAIAAAAIGCGNKTATMDCKSAEPRPQLQGSSNDAVLLRYHYAPGQKVGMDIAMSVDMKISADDQKATMGMKIRMGAEVTWTAADDKELTGDLVFTKVALDVDGSDMPGGSSVHWSSDDSSGPMALEPLKAMIGPKMNVKLSTRGEVLATDWHPIEQAMRDAGAAADMLSSMTNDSMLKSSFVLLPEKPVKIGDEWDAGEVVQKQQMGEMKMHMTYAVAAVSGDKSRVLLQAKPDLKIDGSGGAMKVDIKKMGSDVWLVFDAAKGGVEDAHVAMCMGMTVSQGSQEGDADLKMDAQYRETRL